MTSGIESLRRELLQATFEHAARNGPYYRKRWGSKWKRVKRPEDLHLLPLLTKDDAIVHQRELLAGAAGACSGTISSGTLSGDKPPLRVLHTAAEAQALRDFLARHAPPLSRAPARGRIRVPWTYAANALRLIRELLAEPQADGARPIAMNVGAGGDGRSVPRR